jgi:protein arginine N-methyltransferase 5
VIVVKTDMRSWPGPTINKEVKKVDILVSELLGSFGDNELSPDCLDGVQHVLHPDHGINIPQNYSAWMTPIATPRLHADLLSRVGGDEKWELPAVVMLHQYDDLCVQPGEDRTAEVKEAWTFTHPLPSTILDQSALRAGGTTDAGGWTGGDGKNEHNVRSCKVTFHAAERGVCHGLGGYFESVLYAPEDGSKPIELSINPVTIDDKSKDMISWFPIFFPLRTPIFVPDNAEIDVSMWRQTDDRKIWYEWFVEVFKVETTEVERVVDEEGTKQKFEKKRRARVAVSEQHSSRANGCLM